MPVEVIQTRKYFLHRLVTSDGPELNLYNGVEYGQMFVIDEPASERNGHVVLATYSALVSLNDPRATWTYDTRLKLRRLKPGDAVTLVVK